MDLTVSGANGIADEPVDIRKENLHLEVLHRFGVEIDHIGRYGSAGNLSDQQCGPFQCPYSIVGIGASFESE